MKKTLGMIGLGAMGRPVSECLLKRGYELFTVVRSEHSRAFAETHGIHILPNPGALAHRTDKILLFVSNYEQCRSLLEGDEGILSALKSGVILLASTVSPKEAASLASLCPSGVSLLDAPVSGGTAGAKSGSLVTMVAGEKSVFDECDDIFSAYAKKKFYIGSEPGQAQALKAVNQMLVGIHMVAAAEAFSLSSSLEIDPEVMFEAISACSGNSNIFQSRVPRFIKEDFRAGASLETLEKDTKICMELAEDAGIPCYLTEKCHELYCDTPGVNRQEQDASSVIRLYRKEGSR